MVALINMVVVDNNMVAVTFHFTFNQLETQHMKQ